MQVQNNSMKSRATLEDGYHDDHLTRFQAILLLQKSNKFGLVKGFKRTQNQPLSLWNKKVGKDE